MCVCVYVCLCERERERQTLTQVIMNFSFKFGNSLFAYRRRTTTILYSFLFSLILVFGFYSLFCLWSKQGYSPHEYTLHLHICRVYLLTPPFALGVKKKKNNINSHLTKYMYVYLHVDPPFPGRYMYVCMYVCLLSV